MKKMSLRSYNIFPFILLKYHEVIAYLIASLTLIKIDYIERKGLGPT